MLVTELTLHADDREQQATLFQPEEVAASLAGVLFLHGYDSNRSGYAGYARRLTQETGTVCLTMDLGGHGASSGVKAELSPRNHLREAANAFDFLADKVDPNRIGVVGASYSGYLTAMLTRGCNPKQILLRAPAIYEDAALDIPKAQMNGPAMRLFRENVTPTRQNRALDAVRDYAGHVLVVESENDESIRKTIPQAYAKAAQYGTLRVLPDATHSLSGAPRQVFSDWLVEWAKQL
jgi:esterase/lipase